MVGTRATTKPSTTNTTIEVRSPLRVLTDQTKFLNLLCEAVSSAILELIPNAITLRNQIPKSYLHYDLYCNLIPNEDLNVNFYN
mmetsp:Transcript_7208/g.10065  ORF Transcript_7208/g.10065 Transcript_7208/m.10065 type:complete len:84 (-) Transcript_7208:138-389(-)